MFEFGRILGLLLTSGIKFFFAPSIAVVAGYSFFETVLITNLGGISSFLLFFKFGQTIRLWSAKIIKPKPRIKFSKRNRFIVKIKRKYGFYGLAFLSPCILSIPLGALIASIYYNKNSKTIPVFIFSIVIWSLILTSISIFFA